MGLFGSTNKTTSTTNQTTKPTDWQQGYLDTAFKGAGDMFAGKQGTPYYQGPTYAAMGDPAKQNLQGQAAYNQGQGLMGAQTLTGAGQQLAGASGGALDALNRYGQMAGQDRTSDIIGNAGRYMNNDVINGQIDAVNRDVARNLREETLPGIDRQASATGGINSSRAGLMAGVAQRGASEQMADNAAQIRAQAYQNGLGLAQQGTQDQMTGLQNLASGYSGLAGQGFAALGQGQDMANNAFGNANSAYKGVQDDQNAQYDDAEKQWQNNDTRDYDLLQRYYGIVGGNQWGSNTSGTTTNTVKQSTGLGSALLGGAMGAVGLAGGLGWKPFG